MTTAHAKTIFTSEPFIPSWAKVASIYAEMGNAWTLQFEVPEGQDVPTFQPGQFAMLYAFGIGEAAISHSGSAAPRESLRFTIRPTGATTCALTRLSVGDTVGIRGPFGRGWPLEQAQDRDLIIMAGGLGLAPIRPVLKNIQMARTSPRRTALIYGARQPEHILYRDEFDDWAASGVEVHQIVDRATGAWDGAVGLVTHLVPKVSLDFENMVAFLCGPEVMMRFSAIALEDAGLPAERIWLSMERNMKCAIGHCGHCQFGPAFVCKEGPVFRFDQIRTNLFCKEI